jgi:enoyl-CoA hydratase/carnithine racemase
VSATHSHAPVTPGSVGRLVVDRSRRDWATAAIADAAAMTSSVIVLALPVGLAPDAPDAARLNAALRASGRFVVVVLDGAYGASALTVAAAGDMCICTTATTFALDSATDAEVHETWIQDLSIRDAKWFAFGAGKLTAQQLAKSGFVNELCAPAELAQTVDRIANHVALVPADLTIIKKRAHDARHRFSASPS